MSLKFLLKLSVTTFMNYSAFEQGLLDLISFKDLSSLVTRFDENIE